MTSARGVVLALVPAIGLIGVARAQAPWPAEPPPTWPPDVLQSTPLGFGGPPPNQQEECVAPFTALRAEVEKKGIAAKAGSEKQVGREEMCKLVATYSAAEAKWIKFAETNRMKCAIPANVVQQMTTVHIATVQGQKKLCAAGLGPGDLRENNPDYRFGPPTRPNDFPLKFQPRLSGR